MTTSVMITGIICVTIVAISLINNLGKRESRPRGLKRPPYDWAKEEE